MRWPRSLIRLFPPERSFDHFVGAGEQGRRGFDADRLGRLEIEDEAKERRLLERQFRGLGALEDAVDERAYAVEAFVDIQSVRHQSAGARYEVVLVDAG